MRAWEQFWCEVWRDPAFIELSADARLLFLWSWTDPSTNLCGLFEASPRKLANALDVGASIDRLGPALKELAAKPLLKYDDENEVVWVVSRVKRANRSPKVAVAMVREFNACPHSPLKAEFKRRYGRQLGL